MKNASDDFQTRLGQANSRVKQKYGNLPDSSKNPLGHDARTYTVPSTPEQKQKKMALMAIGGVFVLPVLAFGFIMLVHKPHEDLAPASTPSPTESSFPMPSATVQTAPGTSGAASTYSPPPSTGIPSTPSQDFPGDDPAIHTPNPGSDGKHYDLACAAAAAQKCYTDPDFAAKAGVTMGDSSDCRALAERMCEVTADGTYVNN